MDPTLSIAASLYHRIRGKGLGLSALQQLNRSECVPTPPKHSAPSAPAPEPSPPVSPPASPQLELSIVLSPTTSHSPAVDAENEPPPHALVAPTSELRRRERAEQDRRQQIRQRKAARIQELKERTSEWEPSTQIRQALPSPSPRERAPLTGESERYLIYEEDNEQAGADATSPSPDQNQLPHDDDGFETSGGEHPPRSGTESERNQQLSHSPEESFTEHQMSEPLREDRTAALLKERHQDPGLQELLIEVSIFAT